MQGGGRRFESVYLHHRLSTSLKTLENKRVSSRVATADRVWFEAASKAVADAYPPAIIVGVFVFRHSVRTLLFDNRR